KYAYLFEFQAEIKKVLEIYDERKKTQNLMDFDDLLVKWLDLLVENPDVKDRYAERFEYILVDEYQDTNLLQAQIIDLLASKHRNVMVVGDDSQSIYSFRGAEFRNIIDFPKKYPDCQIFKLELNHRSTPEILHFANDSIANAEERFEKNLKPVRKKGVAPVVVPFRDVYKQAAFVAQRILELHDAGMSLNDMAVIYRSHYHCLELQVELTRRSIPHEVRSGMRLFEEAHIKDVTSYLKVFHNPYDGLAWMRILRLLPKIGQKTADKIWKLISKSEDPVAKIKSIDALAEIPASAKDTFSNFQVLIKALERMAQSPSAMIQTILENGYSDYLRMSYPNFANRQEELEELSNYALEYKSLEQFLSSLALIGDTAAEDIVSAGEGGDKEAVVLTTVHQAKGLEWKTVFVIWLAEGRFPSYKTFGNKKEEEEERRLFYVAVTRSKDQLYLAYPLVYQSREGTVVMKASRFINEISEHRYDKWVVEEEDPSSSLGASDRDEYDDDGIKVVEWGRL
ncbi:MAG: ATP-dependent helicase, partial [Candidatus Margulisiibacteriota bacterium]